MLIPLKNILDFATLQKTTLNKYKKNRSVFTNKNNLFQIS